ncbi:unnamed protein product [Microthlaspi erraticum]|uniref:DUF7054 domain-containing protein n=1 Tax=Microthlaspi erraticum TaxID=1685480 RepID=A0A6D2K268_9BRAS|nr:unnamed protein product [Microthlaspi erraticum]
MIKEIGNVKGVIKEPNKRLLVSVNVLGSVGPISFLANEDDRVSSVINTALKAYAREGRIPVLGFDVDNLICYSVNAGFNIMNPQEMIGSVAVTKILLCKKEPEPEEEVEVEERRKGKARAVRGWKSRLLRSLFYWKTRR